MNDDCDYAWKDKQAPRDQRLGILLALGAIAVFSAYLAAAILDGVPI